MRETEDQVEAEADPMDKVVAVVQVADVVPAVAAVDAVAAATVDLQRWILKSKDALQPWADGHLMREIPEAVEAAVVLPAAVVHQVEAAGLLQMAGEVHLAVVLQVDQKEALRL